MEYRQSLQASGRRALNRNHRPMRCPKCGRIDLRTLAFLPEPDPITDPLSGRIEPSPGCNVAGWPGPPSATKSPSTATGPGSTGHAPRSARRARPRDPDRAAPRRPGLQGCPWIPVTVAADLLAVQTHGPAARRRRATRTRAAAAPTDPADPLHPHWASPRPAADRPPNHYCDANLCARAAAWSRSNAASPGGREEGGPSSEGAGDQRQRVARRRWLATGTPSLSTSSPRETGCRTGSTWNCPTTVSWPPRRCSPDIPALRSTWLPGTTTSRRSSPRSGCRSSRPLDRARTSPVIGEYWRIWWSRSWPTDHQIRVDDGISAPSASHDLPDDPPGQARAQGAGAAADDAVARRSGEGAQTADSTSPVPVAALTRA